MITAVCWRWGGLFSAAYVNRLRAALELHLALPHELVCVTDDPRGIDPRVRIVPLPTTYAETPRCRRRMEVFSLPFAIKHRLGPRILTIDLDVVIVGDLTKILEPRREPVNCWRVGYAGVFSGSFHVHQAGALDGMWKRFEADPYGYPKQCSGEPVPSDQAMLNAYLKTARIPVSVWTEADGFVTYFGRGYESKESLGVGPNRQELPPGARIVVLGSADKEAMEGGESAWIREHWLALPGEARA